MPSFVLLLLLLAAPSEGPARYDLSEVMTIGASDPGDRQVVHTTETIVNTIQTSNEFRKSGPTVRSLETSIECTQLVLGVDAGGIPNKIRRKYHQATATSDSQQIIDLPYAGHVATFVRNNSGWSIEDLRLPSADTLDTAISPSDSLRLLSGVKQIYSETELSQSIAELAPDHGLEVGERIQMPGSEVARNWLTQLPVDPIEDDTSMSVWIENVQGPILTMKAMITLPTVVTSGPLEGAHADASYTTTLSIDISCHRLQSMHLRGTIELSGDVTIRGVETRVSAAASFDHMTQVTALEAGEDQ